MEDIDPGSRPQSAQRGRSGPERRQADLVGTSAFWLTCAVTLCAALAFVFVPPLRAWLACAVLLMWAGFFTANAIRSRRTHSVISAPVYVLAAALLASNASGWVQMEVWMLWVLGAGILAANLSERVVGKYL